MFLLRWALAVVALPGTVLCVVPASLLFLTDGPAFYEHIAGPGEALFWLAILFALAGCPLGLWTMHLFWHIGRGTPAPWDPPQTLVVKGPYRHVRNPMITSVLLNLLAEACLFKSWGLLLWFSVFFVVNAIYFPGCEEPGLLARFGDDYRLYSQHVGRWVPRLTPWDLPTKK